jgi:hypothetical protein
MVVEVVVDARAVWSKVVDSCSTREDLAAADAAVQHALAGEWFAVEKSIPFDFEVYCDTTEELRAYVQTRKLRETEIPYDDLEARQRERSAEGQPARLRCRRPWMLSTYSKK